MTVILNTRENVVIAFFWLVFAAMILTAVVNVSGLVFPRKSLPDAGSAEPQPSAETKIAEYQKVLSQNPGNLQALIGLGDVYFDSQRLPEAIEIFTRALTISPTNAHVLNDLGLLNLKTGDLDEAMKHFQGAITIDPTHQPTLYYIGLIHRHNGETAKALEAYERLLALNPTPEMAQKVNQEIEALRAQHGTPE